MSLTASEVLSLISACKESGITNFKLGELELTFNASQPQQPIPAQLAPEPAVEDLQISESQMKELEAISKARFIEELRLTDPEAYEDLIAQGDLEDGSEADN